MWRNPIIAPPDSNYARDQIDDPVEANSVPDLYLYCNRALVREVNPVVWVHEDHVGAADLFAPSSYFEEQREDWSDQKNSYPIADSYHYLTALQYGHALEVEVAS